ncbi:MAG: acyltransferase family protein, partial [Mycobacterium sp.]
VHTAWNWAVLQFELTLAGPGGIWLLLGVFAVAFAGAAALYHFVEEPARRWMRRMVDVRDATPAVQSVGRDDRKLSA